MAVGVAFCTAAGAACLWAAVRERRLLSRLRQFGLRTEGTVIRQEVTDPAEPIRVPVARGDGGSDRRGPLTHLAHASSRGAR
ncbi:hypothetical protein P3T39_005525 [Kitasatospora sp. GP82]|nr:hypothetical protein [Kitasatospora sp. GP82]